MKTEEIKFMENKKSKIYIAGKITGDKDYKYKFEKAKNLWEYLGFIVLNPAILPSGMSNEDYMKICFAMIDVADAVLFLKDYKESKGAMLEYQYCEYIKKEMIFQK